MMQLEVKAEVVSCLGLNLEQTELLNISDR